MHLRRVRVARGSDGFQEDALAIGQPQPCREPRREATALRQGFDDSRVQAVLERRADLARKFLPVQPRTRGRRERKVVGWIGDAP